MDEVGVTCPELLIDDDEAVVGFHKADEAGPVP